MAAATARMMRATVARVADGGDVDGIRHVYHLRTLADQAMRDAVRGLLAQGYSLADIARPLGITRQAVRLYSTNRKDQQT